MSEIRKWDYYAASCRYEVMKKSLLGAAKEGRWTLNVGEVMGLSRGLDYMGEQGYELVGIQLTNLESRGEGSGGYYQPNSMYIFKRPRGT